MKSNWGKQGKNRGRQEGREDELLEVPRWSKPAAKQEAEVLEAKASEVLGEGLTKHKPDEKLDLPVVLAEEENLQAQLAGADVDKNAEVEWLMQTHLGKRPALEHRHLKPAAQTPEATGSDSAAAPQENSVSCQKQEQPGLVYEILDWSKYILLALLIGLLITGFVIQRNEVVGISMDPTLRNQDRVWVQKLSKLWGGIERGDIVTVHGAALSDGALQQEDLVKRVVAVAGDRLEIKGGAVYLNGELLPEPYLAADVDTLMPDRRELDIVVPQGQYFVMGDNRPNSKDSRYFGSIKADAILGEVWFRTWPMERLGFVK